MVHDLQVTQKCNTNAGHLVNGGLLFSATKHVFGVNPRGLGGNPRDVDHTDLKLAPEGTTTTIAPRLRLRKPAYY